MRSTLGGVLAGGLVSVLGLSAASLVSEQPAGFTPPDAPLVDAPQVEAVEPETETAGEGLALHWGQGRNDFLTNSSVYWISDDNT